MPFWVQSRRGPICLISRGFSLTVSVFLVGCFVRLLVMASLPRVVPTASSDDLVIEDVATLLADITKQPDVDVRSKGVVETLLAAETVGLLKDHPLLKQLASDMQDGSKRRRLESSRRPVACLETSPGDTDAVALGADLPTQAASAIVASSLPAASMAADEGSDAMAVDSAPSLSASWQVQDKAPSVTITQDTLDDYTSVEHEDVEQLQAWIQAQLEEAKDPSVVLPLIEDKVVMLQKDFPYLAVIDLFSRSHPWWDTVCRFYSVVPAEVGKIKGQDITPTVLARWYCLRREDRIKLLAHVDATSKEFFNDPSLFISGLMHMREKLPFENVGTVVLFLPALTREELMGNDRAELGLPFR